MLQARSGHATARRQPCICLADAGKGTTIIDQVNMGWPMRRVSQGVGNGLLGIPVLETSDDTR